MKVSEALMVQVELYSRSGCHLCEVAKAEIEKIKEDLVFDLVEILIDGDSELEDKYGMMVPVILINGKVHGYGRVESERMRSALFELS